MADTTAIEWCDSTFNPWIGCTRVSPACDDCYAARSTPARTLGIAWGTGAARHRTGKHNWCQPAAWQHQAEAFRAEHGRSRRVFCASLADWLDNEVPTEWLVDLMRLVRDTPDLNWLLLSKRIGNWPGRLTKAAGMAALRDNRARWPGMAEWLCDWLDGKSPRNAWLGCTTCNQQEYDRDIGKLLRTPAAVHFLSVEPMLGRIYMRMGGASTPDYSEHRPLARLDWVICGGESGPKARPMHPEWSAHLRDQCDSAGVSFMFKQWGEWRPLLNMTRDEHFHQQGADWLWLKLNGTTHRNDDETPYDVSDAAMKRIGKKEAGRLLDWREHNAFPAGVDQ